MPSKPEEAKKLQQKYMEYQMLDQQIKQIQQQLERLESQAAEAMAIRESVADISKAKPGEEILVPITGGIFFKAKAVETASFLVNVGSNVVVEKDSLSTQELLKKQEAEISKFREQLMSQLSQVMGQFISIEKELKELVK